MFPRLTKVLDKCMESLSVNFCKNTDLMISFDSNIFNLYNKEENMEMTKELEVREYIRS